MNANQRQSENQAASSIRVNSRPLADSRPLAERGYNPDVLSCLANLSSDEVFTPLLRDVITQLEPGLFKKVTGLTVKDFELLVSLGVFNSALMNDAVYKFKRYEDPSLGYMGINKHEGEDIGLYDTVLRRGEYEAAFVNEPGER